MKRSSRNSLSRSIKTLTLAVALLLPFAAPQKACAGAALWQETNLQYLWGNNFRIAPTKEKDHNQATITIEHADAWKYGDNFLFLDITNPTEKDIAMYGEISPRLSIGKITGLDLSAPFIKDVLLAGTLEVGTYPSGGGFHNYLYGLGLSLNLPKFNFADLNLYVRNSMDKQGVTYQVTPVWQVPFNIGKASFVCEGFVDIAGGEGNSAFNIDAQPRLLLDAGKLWGSPGNLYVGTEFIYWRNKYGFSGINEYAPQVMVKWVL
ncbi:outer membrane channel-forming protein, putative [Citrifermentans bemidjiense Bem]|uniref:Outer membrane channel-forming protein, putative n=1 Tax=Citrifermentans bemidjiense (strain ATCC BAA-1014 / DSM 16622 / JCM 12645 / Bem) TaxID=404380 RepID=B5EFC5_CITBB|nr:DUF5020 family protein [Citrifermentans bemidjiense]ACH40880.1 outer membrane channel-forming protein, putative [Citrifermentans bemidjiense Bem]